VGDWLYTVGGGYDGGGDLDAAEEGGLALRATMSMGRGLILYGDPDAENQVNLPLGG
jgi:hypothetical protein